MYESETRYSKPQSQIHSQSQSQPMLIAALGTGFMLELGTPFKFLSGALAVGAAVIKGMFY